jgi:hypothetical protein
MSAERIKLSSNLLVDEEDEEKGKEIDERPLKFGKHIGKTPKEVAKIEPSYIVWLADRSGDFDIVSEELYDMCNNEEDEYDERYGFGWDS